MRADMTDFLRGSEQSLPNNMTTPFNGTMNVVTIGWTFHQRTHGVALAAITLVTLVTASFGIFALVEANSRNAVHDPPRKGGTVAFNPTDMVDVLMASSTGNLLDALSQRKVKKDSENLRVRLAVTDEGQFALNAGR